MSALIWDSTTQSFKDADTPKIYSGSSFGDAEGKIWNETAQAWEDAWNLGLPDILELFYDGVSDTRYSGGMGNTGYTQGSSRIDLPTLRSNGGGLPYYLYFEETGSASAYSVYGTINPIDLTKYNNLIFTTSNRKSYHPYADNEAYVCITPNKSPMFTNASQYTSNIDNYVQNISAFTGEYYVFAWIGTWASGQLSYYELHRLALTV